MRDFILDIWAWRENDVQIVMRLSRQMMPFRARRVVLILSTRMRPLLLLPRLSLPQCPSDDTLSQYLHGDLADDQAGRIEDHVEACAECERRLQELSDQPQAATSRDPEEPVPD